MVFTERISFIHRRFGASFNVNIDHMMHRFVSGWIVCRGTGQSVAYELRVNGEIVARKQRADLFRVDLAQHFTEHEKHGYHVELDAKITTPTAVVEFLMPRSGKVIARFGKQIHTQGLMLRSPLKGKWPRRALGRHKNVTGSGMFPNESNTGLQRSLLQADLGIRILNESRVTRVSERRRLNIALQRPDRSVHNESKPNMSATGGS
ncbi:hypothetical protein FDP25_08780 [Roseovarius sp. A21]|uniref:Uncharacterized protein n=1 Tax=Roseovarius bejariae TaxID=2576383 RepID=A0A844CJL7_9RHOB|nr:hypothetical protein [Roseovarius bejariae]MRU15521.1 hypothetical protein [Roseovarius bejariae]